MLKAALVLVLGCFIHNAHGAESGLHRLIGKPRPELALFDTSGETTTLERWNGRVIVLNFWATWCGPCRKEIPLLNSLQKEFKPQGVQIVGVAVDNALAVEKFMQQIPIDYPVLIGGLDALDLIAQYGNTAGSLPYTAFIDRQGKIQALASGALTDAYTRKMLEKLLAAK